MESICEKHQKDVEFKCCVSECSQLMCTECLIHPHQDSSALFYCDSCVSKHQTKTCIILCQPVTNPTTLEPNPVEAKEHNEKDDLSSLRVELFPTDDAVVLESDAGDKEKILTVVPAQDEMNLSSLRVELFPPNDHVILEGDAGDEDYRLTAVPQVDGVNEDLALAQTLNPSPTYPDNHDSLHLPSWYIETMTSDLEPKEIHNDISKRCWLTEDLQEEIRRNYPTKEEIRMNEAMGDCVRDLEAFKVKCSYVFPVGRVFLSKIQFVQAAKHFLDGWNVKKVHHGKKIRCFFSDNSKKTESTCDPEKRRVTYGSVKKQYNCPFEIRYSYIDLKKHSKVPLSFFKVKITWCNYNHTCQLSSIFYKTATQLSRGKVKLDLCGMNTVIMLLKTNPAIDTRSLRSLLAEYVHKDVAIDCTYMRNFRQRVAYFHATNPNYTDLTINEANLLLEMNPLSEEEHKVLDNPIIRINFQEMLLKIMAEDSSTWEALAFLRRCKDEMPGFDFRIRLNERNHPCSLVFTTANGRNNAIRYGDVISLDMQHRQHNKHNWPYFGPIVKTSDMSIGVICEAIVISENIDSYAWVLKKWWKWNLDSN